MSSENKDLFYKKTLKLIATYFGVGLSPKAPGTVATLATIPLFLLLSQLPDVAYLGITLGICILGIFAAQAYEETSITHDSQEIVIDEVAGFLITMALVPVSWKNISMGFILFRLLDIFKPWPIGYLDKKIQGGVGVMADDIAAGLIASVIMQLLLGLF